MKILLLPAIILSATFSAGAQTWSYNDCLDYARQHNITLQKSVLNEQVSDLTLEEAKAQWQPSLDFATSHNVTNTPWSENRKNGYNSSYGLNAGWTVWNGGSRENTIKRSKVSTGIDRLATTDVLRTLETDLLQVYINILYAKEAITINEEAVKLSEAQVDRMRQLMEGGRVSRVDYAQLQAQLEQDRYNLVNSQGTYDNRRMELKRLLQLGIDSDIQLEQVEWTAAQVLASLPPIEESYNMALATDVRLQSLDLEAEVAQIDEAIAKAGRMPRISLNAGVGTGYSTPGAAFGTQMKQSWNESLGLTLSIPILDNKKTKVAVAKAKVQTLNTQLDRDSRINELSQAVETWYIDTRAAQSRYTAGEGQVRSAEVSNELVNEQFKLGLVNPVELMNAHNALLEARHSLLQAKYMAILGHKMIDFYRTATVNIN